MAARTGARTGLPPPALASYSDALIHSATEGTNVTSLLFVRTICMEKKSKLVPNFPLTQLSITKSSIFKVQSVFFVGGGTN